MKQKKNVYYELELEHEIEYYCPARPAPVCSNHDDPRYSDSGCDEEIEYNLYIVLSVKGKTIRIPLDELERNSELKPLVNDIYRATLDDVLDDARYDYDHNLADAMGWK